MRRPVLFCLILLLAWRAWLGDAMALGALRGDAAPTPPVAVQTLQTLQTLPMALPPVAAGFAPTGADGPADARSRWSPAGHGPTGHALGTPPCHDSSLSSTPAAEAMPHASADSAQASHGGTCTACQICHLALLSPQRPAPALPGQRFATPQSAEGGFQSACLNPQLKPPIG